VDRPLLGEPSSVPSREEDTKLAPARQHRESFLHLPVTVALSGLFSSRVVSLPNAADPVKWGNPDMLMLRASPISSMHEVFRDAELDPKIFGKVDVTPECILSSVEVKGGLDRSRPSMFQAIAEAAANSRWANDGLRVFVDWKPSA